MSHIVHSGGTVREKRVGKVKCRALAYLAVFSAFVAFVIFQSIGDYEKLLQIFELPILWLLAAALPAVVFAILACIVGIKEKPTTFYVGVPDDQDPKKLYSRD